MNKDHEKEQDRNNPRPEDESSNEEIPLWLQGIEDDESDETKPITSEAESAGTWVPEIADTSTEPSSEIESEAPKSVESSEVESTADLGTENFQEILKDETRERYFTEDEKFEMAIDREITEEINLEALSETEVPQSIEPFNNGLPSQEGFVDISELEIPESPMPQDLEEAVLDQEHLREGDLPEWLQEMITEPEEPQTSVDEPQTAEESEWIDEPESPAIDNHHLDAEVEDEELVPENEMPPKSKPELEPELEIPVFVAEEDTTPVSVARDHADDAPPSTEVEEWVDTEQQEEDERLNRVRQHLDQGDLVQATPIIKNMVEEAAHIEKLETWLMEATQSEAITNSHIWEVMGDIAMKRDKPEDAFLAYAKAVKYLLIDEEVNHETG